jgi:hypothetical protein
MNQPRAACGVLPAMDIVAPRQPSPSDEPPGPVLQRWLDGTGRLVASGGRDAESWWMHWAGLGTFSFGPEGPVRVQPAAPGLTSRLEDTFVRGVIPIVLLARGCEAFHGSAVADARGVVAFCASSGTGKSTLALALSTEGLRHWADDTVAWCLRAGRPVALRLPCPVRVDDPAHAVLGFAPGGSDTADERPLRRIYHLVRDRRLDPSRPSIAPIPPRARFDRLLAHAPPFDLDGEARRRRFIEAVLGIAASVDMWECRFAPSLAALATHARALRAHVESA